MAVRRILKWPSAKLRLKAKPITDFSEAEILAKDCYDTMLANLGVGVAAPQVGFSKMLLVVDSKVLPSVPSSSLIEGACVLVNPQIDHLTDDKFEWEEACLSVDDVQALVKRTSKVLLTFKDLGQVEHSLELEGQEAGVIQHEADHLEGKLFIDHLPAFERRRIIKKVRRKNLVKTKEKKEKNRKHLAEIKKQKSRKSRKKTKKTFGKNKRRK